MMAFAAISDPEQEALAALDRGTFDAALTILMNAYGGAVYRYCLGMLSKTDLAEDARQLTFIQAHQGFRHFERRSSFRSWIFGIAHHRCLDLLKAHRRRQDRFSPLEDAVEPPVPTESADARLAARARGQALTRCLSKLPQEKRAAVLLRFQQELSYPEIAALVNENAATLQMRVSRTLIDLRKCLQREGWAA